MAAARRMRLSPSGPFLDMGDQPWGAAEWERLMVWGDGALTTRTIDLPVAPPIPAGPLSPIEQRYSLESTFVLDSAGSGAAGDFEVVLSALDNGVVLGSTPVLGGVNNSANNSQPPAYRPMGYVDVPTGTIVTDVRIEIITSADLSRFTFAVDGSRFWLRRLR